MFFPRYWLSEIDLPSSFGRVNSGALSLISMGHAHHTQDLYRRKRFHVSPWLVPILLTGLAWWTRMLCGQPGLLATSAIWQHRNPHKLRATALLELTTKADGRVTAQLTPITILDDNRFHDASI